MNAASFGATPLLPHEFDGLRRVIRKVAGIHLRENKQQLVAGRLHRRLKELRLASFSEYLRLVEDDTNRAEQEELVNCITTNKTSFFREPHHFELLKKRILPEIVDRARSGGPRRVRIWSAGCSTGQEPWSIAMMVAETLGSLAGWDVRILASDLDTRVLEKAERAVYDGDELEGVSRPMLDRWFDSVAGGQQVKPALRSLVTFRRINLVAPATWSIRTRFDVVFCRNVAIYFDRETQAQLFTGFASLLEPTGYLMSGHSENLHGLANVLRPIGNTTYVLAAPSNVLRTTTAAAMPARGAGEHEPGVAIQIGGVHASASGERIRTTLGSCIAVCLFDPEARVGGMNHFLLPEGSNPQREPSSFGVHAMEVLINAMMKLGGDRRRFVAKVFGASEQFPHAGTTQKKHVARRNVEFALAFLKEEGIPVVAQKVGGNTALNVVFDTSDGRAFVRAFDSKPELATTERRHLDALATKARALTDDVVFFGAT